MADIIKHHIKPVIERPIRDVTVHVAFNPEASGILSEGEVQLSALLTVSLKGDSTVEVLDDMRQHFTEEQLENSLGIACAEAFTTLFGIQILDETIH